MDAVPEQVGVVLFEAARAVGVSAMDLADGRIVAHLLEHRAEAERRAGEAGDLGLVGEPEDFDHVGQRRGHRLIDEQRLAGGDHRPGLFQVRPPVDALQQDGVDMGQHRSIVS